MTFGHERRHVAGREQSWAEGRSQQEHFIQLMVDWQVVIIGFIHFDWPFCVLRDASQYKGDGMVCTCKSLHSLVLLPLLLNLFLCFHNSL